MSSPHVLGTERSRSYDSDETRWSGALAAPLRSIFAIVSATRQTALNFRDRLIASGGLRCPDECRRRPALFSQVASCVSGRLVQRTSEPRGWLGLIFSFCYLLKAIGLSSAQAPP